MFTIRGAFYTIIAGACAFERFERAPQSGELNDTRDQTPTIISNQISSSGQEVKKDFRNELLEYTEGRVPLTGDDGLEARQVASFRPPTVFSTQYMTSTITSYAGEPVTSTIFATVTSTLTLTDPASGRKTETLTVTFSPAPQKRTVPRMPNIVQLHSKKAITSLDDLPLRSDQGKRQNNPTTVTSIILMISRTVVTAAPTVLITSTATLSSTLTTTLPISTTTSQVVTIFTGSDGSTTTLSPSTTSLPGTSSQSSQTILPTGTPKSSTVNQGAIAGGVIGGIVGVALLLGILFCFLRRKRKHTEPGSRISGYPTTVTSSSSLDPDRGTLIHHETFHVGTSPPASVAPSASEQQLPIHKPAPLEMRQPVVPAGAIRTVQRSWGTVPSQSHRSEGFYYIDDEEEDGSNGSGLDSTEAQPPSPVASSDIFGPYNSTYRPGRDTWASSVGMSFSTPRNVSILDDTGLETPRMSGSTESILPDEEQDRRDSWTPTIPQRSKPGPWSKELDRTVRFKDDSTTLSRRSRSRDGSVNGSSAFL
ncbi:hypothetical protein N0V93_002630 [Gnomoniopsis smithogilvyi]|uniref:Uncharacterized protein n=1 Tax=Gnomoniopsis smithogilvyi TaxID=1191159 RepID=A0A9W8YV57_9PEZI|nr:hypothetical protein N0V93_002630 [Gnomoniopsis smithogilvyi]